MQVTKRGVSLTQGPSKRSGDLELETFAYDGYGTLEVILRVFDDKRVPDFSGIHAQVAKMRITIPDDPIDVGFTEVKKLICDVATQYQLLSSYRCEVIGIKTEWLSLGIEFDQLLKGEQAILKELPEYQECKNADSRKAFVDGRLATYDKVATMIEITKQRCNDFIEVARTKGKELDRVMDALGRQLDIIKLQVKLRHILPRDVEDDD